MTPSKYGMAAGWGGTGASLINKNRADVLKDTCLPVVSKPVCQSAYLRYVVTDNMLCAGYAAGGQDTCRGDSGGGFVFYDSTSNKWLLGGVVSWGSDRGCGLANKYAVFVKIARFVQWIDQNMF